MRGLLARLACLIALLASSPASAASDLAGTYRELQQRDQHLFAVGWKLVRGNAPFCADATPALGLMLHDATTYPDPPSLRAAFGLHGDIAVQAVAERSPAAMAGLAPDATLRAVGDDRLADHYPPSEPNWRRLATILDRLDSELLAAGQVALEWRTRDGSARSAVVTGVPACRTRFEVTGIGKRAVADGRRVLVGTEFIGFAYPEAEFAAAVAHELAHNLLGHRAWLDAHGRSRSHVRLTEREADRLSPWLLANAGYDPAAAVRFMRQWGPDHDGGLFRRRTHDGWDERAEFIAAELPLIAAARDNEGKADWARQFRREIAD